MKRLSILIGAALCALAQNPQNPPATAPPLPTPTGGPQLEDGLYAVFNTQMGIITAKLFETETPRTVANFVGLAKGTKPWKDPKGIMVRRPLYSNIGFYRVMSDQMIQSGSAVASGEHDCGITLKGEVRPDLKFDQPGRLAMANTGPIDSGACQFFIALVSGATANPWNGQYTIFGQVVDGLGVVKEISRTPAVNFIAKNPPKLISVTIKRVGPEPAPPAPAKKIATPAAGTVKK